MPGHIRKRSASTYSLIFDLPRGEDNKRNQKWITFKGSKKDAGLELGRLMSEANTGAFGDPSKLTVVAFLRTWIEQMRAHREPRTIQGYEQIINTYLAPALGGVKLAKLRPLHIQNYYSYASEKLKLSARTILHHHALLHKALKDAVRWQAIPRNPCDAVDKPKPKRPNLSALDTAEALKLLDVCKGTCWHTPILLALTTGLRRGELIGLRWSDIDLDKPCLKVQRSVDTSKGNGLRYKAPKTEKSKRTVPLLQTVTEHLRLAKAAHLRACLEEGQPESYRDVVCAYDDGSPMMPDSLSRAVPRLLAKAEVKGVRLHDLRHTYPMMMLRLGVPLKVISDLMGHSTITITADTYMHDAPDMAIEAAGKLDALLFGG